MASIKFGLNTKYQDEAVDKNTLGGKGAGLVAMSLRGVPVPPGFTIPTSVSNEYREADGLGEINIMKAVMSDVLANMEWLEAGLCYAPLVSVRSGAPVSMPGMMDTILNVGLTSGTFAFWEKKIGKRATLDTQRRLIQMLGSTAFGVPHEVFEEELAKVKKAYKKDEDSKLPVVALEKLVAAYNQKFKAVTQQEFPDTVEGQLEPAIKAVFNSWGNERAKTYRALNNIDAATGTACTVQTMVFGNMNNDSGSGVLFSRDGSTGDNAIMGEFLVNAQGEDVVAGIRTPQQLIEMQVLWPEVLTQLAEITTALEADAKDMVDVEFTVQDKVLYILQCRTGKRTAVAAFKIARDLVDEEVITKEEALKRLTKEQYKLTKRPVIDPKFKTKPNVSGLFGSVGLAYGKVVFTSAAALECTEPCILVTQETSPDDVGGMAAAKGVLTATGGQTSHAAVVARGMDKPCVVGCIGVVELIKEAGCEYLTIDGSTGNVWFGVNVPVVDSAANEDVAEVTKWVVGSKKITPHATSMIGFKNDGGKGPVHLSLAEWTDATPGLYSECQALLSYEYKKEIIFDLRTQGDFKISGDGPLLSLYASVNEVEAEPAMVNWLVQRKQNFAGATVIGVSAPQRERLGPFFNYVGMKANTISDLLDGGELIISEALSNKMTNEEFVKLTTMMDAAGKKVTTPILGMPVPAEYQVLQALGG
jgi:pyruvate,orthophosphate dikinase